MPVYVNALVKWSRRQLSMFGVTLDFGTFSEYYNTAFKVATAAKHLLVSS